MSTQPSYEILEQRLKELEEKTAKLQEAETALRQSGERLSQIIQRNPIPTFVINADHRVTHCNEAFEKLNGVSGNEIIGTDNHWMHFYPSRRPLLADLVVNGASEEAIGALYEGKSRKSLTVEGGYEAEAFFPDLGENGKWLLFTAVPLRDNLGHITGAVETLQDVTDRRRAEEAVRQREQRLTQIVRGSSIPTFVIDNNHRITHCNRAFENMIGISSEELIGTCKQWMPFYASERPVLADFLVDNIPEEKIRSRYGGGKFRKSDIVEGAYEAEQFFPDLGETGEWLFATAAPLFDNNEHIAGAIETVQNITEGKRVEEALRKSEKRYRTLLDFVPDPLVVYDIKGRVSYLNPAFTKVFGWTFQELDGKRIEFVPPDKEQETRERIRDLLEHKTVVRYETTRTTKDGRLIDVSLSAALLSERDEDDLPGQVVILSDITQEKRLARQNEAVFRISMALPEYPDIEELLDYINSEVKQLCDAEGANIILKDEENDELFFPGVSYDDSDTQRRVKDIRFPMDQLATGRTIRTGVPQIINDTSLEPEMHIERDKRLGYHTRKLLVVPLKSSDRIIGALTAVNKKHGDYEKADMELLSIIAGTVALSIENARFSDEIKQAYREVSSMNRAKDRVIHHLSHELKTPVSVLIGSLKILRRKLGDLSDDKWKPTLARADRNLQRILEIQYQAQDIVGSRHFLTYDLLTKVLDQCADQFESLLSEEFGEAPVIPRIRKRLEEIFAASELTPRKIDLAEFVRERIKVLQPSFLHRELDILTHSDPVPPILIPEEILQKVFDGLLKNAIENTPDEGKIEIRVQRKDRGAQIEFHDYGTGITAEDQPRIFDGFFTTRTTLDYSSKRPFDFNAGGKGSDLLRMKIFSERHNFVIHMTSTRCGFIPTDADTCPGRISDCVYCKKKEDCYRSGETSFSVTFPAAPGIKS
ncbi:MAG: PAS domain S-box protein [Desulfatiglandales bacterium]